MTKSLNNPADVESVCQEIPANGSRRHFLKSLAVSVPATALMGACSNRDSASRGTWAFFSPAEKVFIDAATGRLIPTDTLGAGANDAGVTRFIDIQLAGAYGRAERWYMRGPWPKGTDEQGFQSRYTPAQIYRDAIAEIDAHCQKQYKKPFAQIPAATQDEVLHALEGDSLALKKVSGKTFFTLLWQNTQEGFLADPAYGGNRDFAGWKLIGFPGPRYNYLEDIGKFGQPYKQPYVSLVGRDPRARAEGEL